MIALPNITLQDAHDQAEQLRTALLSAPLEVEGKTVSLTSSFGVAQCDSDSDTLESLLRDADHALYESKRHGRNTVSVHAVNAV